MSGGVGGLQRFGRGRTEKGSALVEVTWLGILLMVPLVYVIITMVTVQRSAFGATEAARAAGRAFVLSPDVATAQARAVDAARVAMLDQGIDLDLDDVSISCAPTPQSCLQPDSTVTVALDLHVRLPLAPSLGNDAAASIGVHTSHVERYGTYREAAP